MSLPANLLAGSMRGGMELATMCGEKIHIAPACPAVARCSPQKRDQTGILFHSFRIDSFCRAGSWYSDKLPWFR